MPSVARTHDQINSLREQLADAERARLESRASGCEEILKLQEEAPAALEPFVAPEILMPRAASTTRSGGRAASGSDRRSDRPPIDRLETDVHKAMSAVRREWCAATDARVGHVGGEVLKPSTSC